MPIKRLSQHFSAVFLGASLCLGIAPAATAQQAPSPYQTNLLKDGAIITGLAGLSVTGLYLVQQKSGLSDVELARLNKNDVPKIDRWIAGKYSDQAQLASDILCYPVLLVAPGVLALNPQARGRFGQVAVMYLETMLTTNALFTMTVGTIYRYRPYLYGTEGGSGRSGKIATNSFFAGHASNAATATFFAAKVFNDFNPESPARPYVWTAAAALPAVTGYLRMAAGKHFLTDVLVGYTVGATVGVLVPHLHKKQNGTGMSIMPLQGQNVNGFAYSGLMLTKRL